MANAAHQSVVDAYAPPSPGGDHAAETQRDRTNRMMSRKTEKFNTREQELAAFKERLEGQPAVRSNIESNHEFVESTKQHSVVEQYTPKEAANDCGKDQRQQQEQSREIRDQEREEKQQGRSSVADKYGDSIERTERQQEKTAQQRKENTPGLGC